MRPAASAFLHKHCPEYYLMVLPLKYSQTIVEIFTDDRKQLPADAVFLHFLIVASLGNQRHTRLQFKILRRTLFTPAEGRIGMFDRIMVLTVLLQER